MGCCVNSKHVISAVQLPRSGTQAGFNYEDQGKNWFHGPLPGPHQSPIDFHDVPRGSEEIHIVSSSHPCYRPLTLHYPLNRDYQEVPDTNTVKFVNLEGGFQGVTLDSQTPESFSIKNLHFHAPSEHTVKGKNLAIEMHLVHATAGGKFAVLGVFFEVSQTRSPLLDAVIRKQPLDIQTELGSLIKSFYFYQGSLTTPPCSEGINWFVLRFGEEMALPATAGQVAWFTSKWAENPDFAGGHGNNRHTLPIDARTVYMMVPDAEA